MATDDALLTYPRWDDPERCAFCGGRLTDGGPGFIDHVEASPRCRERFDDWRERVGGDMAGEWSG